MDDLERRNYLKPGVWISLAFHLTLFAFLFFYGSQKLRQQDSFVELAEFNLVQPLKEVDATPPLKSGAHQTSVTHTTKSVPKKSLDQPAFDKSESQSPVTPPKSESVDAPNATTAKRDAGLIADAAGVISENDGWQSSKQNSPASTSSVPTLSGEAKKVVIAAHAGAEESSDNLTGWGRYGHQLSIEAAKIKKYPIMAVSGRMQGKVLVSVKVSQSGDVLVSVKRGSGYDLLDDQAVMMVNQAVKNLAIPAELRNTAKELFIPIQFSL